MGQSTIRIKARKTADQIEVKILITHPMETGFRRTLEADVVPEHFIKEVTCYHNDNLVLKSHWGVAVSKDPYLSFKMSGGAVGDIIRVSWRDNRGGKESLDTQVRQTHHSTPS